MDAAQARLLAEQTKDELFKKESSWIYISIKSAAEEGKTYFEHVFPEIIRTGDIDKLKDELKGKGFKVSVEYGLHDKIIVQW